MHFLASKHKVCHSSFFSTVFFILCFVFLKLRREFGFINLKDIAFYMRIDS